MELENIHRAVKKSYLPSNIILALLAFLQWGNIGTVWKYFPLDVLSNGIYYFNALCGIILLLLCGAEIMGYFIWRRKAKKAAKEDGSFVATRGTKVFQLVMLAILLTGLAAYWISCADARVVISMIVWMAMLLINIGLAVGVSKLMKRMKLPAKTNRNVTLVITLVASVAAVNLLAFHINELLDKFLPEEDPAVTYEYHGNTWKLYHDEIPLTIQDLMDVDPDIYSYAWISSHESFLVGQHGACQRPRMDMLDQPDLEYTIVEVKVDFLYDFCLNTILKGRYGSYLVDIDGNLIRDTYFEVTDPAWGADAVYQLQNGTTPANQFLLCYDNVFVELDPEWVLTDEQKAIVGDIFG